MNRIQHTLLAKALIDANGGVDACCKPVTRYERTRLYEFFDPQNLTAYMPADVIDVLESRCGNPLYSTFLATQIRVEPESEDLAAEAADVDEAGNDVWRFIRKITAEGRKPTANEQKEAERLLQRVDRESAELRSLIGGASS